MAFYVFNQKKATYLNHSHSPKAFSLILYRTTSRDATEFGDLDRIGNRFYFRITVSSRIYGLFFNFVLYKYTSPHRCHTIQFVSYAQPQCTRGNMANIFQMYGTRLEENRLASKRVTSIFRCYQYSSRKETKSICRAVFSTKLLGQYFFVDSTF